MNGVRICCNTSIGENAIQEHLLAKKRERWDSRVLYKKFYTENFVSTQPMIFEISLNKGILPYIKDNDLLFVEQVHKTMSDNGAEKDKDYSVEVF